MNPREITDVSLLQSLLVELLNQHEEMRAELSFTQGQLAEALDEIKRLKGEKGNPRFGSSKRKPKGRKIPKLKPSKESSSDSDSGSGSDFDVDRTEMVATPPQDLPLDAEFKGYRSVYQRDIEIIRKNVEYRIARWYSASEGKYYESELPAEYRGQIGSMLKSFVQILHHCGDMTHRKILELLNHLGIKLSAGGMSNILTHSDWVCEEQAALLKSSLGASPYVQMDSTSSKEKGVRMYPQIICGKYFSLFYTQKGKSRLDIYAALQGQSREEVTLAYNPLAKERLVAAKVSQKHLEYFEKTLSLGQLLSMAQLQAFFDSVDIFAKTNRIRRSVIAGALAAGYYHQQTEVPIIESLMSDDAREYRGVSAKNHSHCWIHAIRHYRILNPTNPYLRRIQATFIDKIWDLYDEIKSYKELPRKRKGISKTQIHKAFDQLLSGSTDYQSLNKQMAVTHQNKAYLLNELEHPDFPLHNNAAERGARRVVRKRDISFHTWSKRGTKIRDAFMSLHQTAKKLEVSFLDYLYDRNSGKYLIKSLAQQVQEKYNN